MGGVKSRVAIVPSCNTKQFGVVVETTGLVALSPPLGNKVSAYADIGEATSTSGIVVHIHATVVPDATTTEKGVAVPSDTL